MSKEIATRRSEELLAILEGVALDDARVSKAAKKAASWSRVELFRMESECWTDEQLATRGFTREEFEIAVEARRPRSEASYFVQMAHERTGMRIRKAEENSAPRSVVNIVMPMPRTMSPEERARAPVIDVEGKWTP